MRLIYADTLFSRIRKNDLEFMQQGDIMACIKDVIDSTPTAFDLESVIRKLEDKTIEELGIDIGKFTMDKKEYSSYCSLCLSDVLEILNSAANATNGKIGG